MARVRNKLKDRQAAALAKKAGRHSDGGGLYLVVDGDSRSRWLYRFTLRGKLREMGMGGFPAVSLADARRVRDEAERMVRDGVDPIEARAESRREQCRKPTFGEIADALVEAKASEWRNEKHRAQWKSTLTKEAAPLRSMPVDQIDTAAILEVLKPLWAEKPETASRLRGRIEAVLDAAKAQDHRSGENPAAWRGHLSHLLPKRQKLTRGHHAAMAYADVPAFLMKLREREAMSALALEFLILTATRSGEVLGARWQEIDIAAKVWTIPAARMKAARAHRVPLCGRALAILEELAQARVGDFVFSTPRGDRALSHNTLANVLNRLGVTGATVHGFRSAFRDWAGHETSFPREIAEQALAHRLGDSAELAYKRGDFLEKRRALMQAWASYIEQDKGEKVIAFKKSGGNSAA